MVGKEVRCFTGDKDDKVKIYHELVNIYGDPVARSLTTRPGNAGVAVEHMR